MPSPFGALGIHADEALWSIDFLSAQVRARPPRNALAREVCAQLKAYFRDAQFKFDLPLDLIGTEYQQRVWRALQRIPSGKILSYGRLAMRLDSGARAVGGACRANPVPIVVPCHRVVATQGLGGFMGAQAGHAMDIKRWLLAHERG